MNEVNKERIEAHKKAYDDLVLWIKHQFANEIVMLLPSAEMDVWEWFSLDNKDLIRGASVRIAIKGGYDFVTMEYLCTMLGATEYRVKAYPACRLHLVFKVPITSKAKLAMQCTGMWTPKWKKEDEQEKK